MKKILLMLGIAGVVAANGQNIKVSIKDPSITKMYPTHEGVPVNHTPLLTPPSPSQNQSGAARAVNSVAIGVAGNLYTALNEGTKPLYADDSISTVVFIHRGLNQANVPNNKGQYLFDVSKDKGSTWNLNIGPLNPNAQYVGTPSARFPQAVITRPNNTLIADSAYLAYTGTWLDYSSSGGTNTEWSGEYRGVGRLDGNAATFTESADIVNGGNVIVAQSFKQSQNGVYWNLHLNFREVPNSSGGVTRLRDSLIIMKGVWNPTTRNVDWTETRLKHDALVEDVNNSGDESTLISDFDIAFDPSGQIGWIALKGDFLNDGKYTYDPVFYRSNDGGNTWSAPIHVNLTEIQQINYNLNTSVSNLATTSGSSDLMVDSFGNPHYLIACLNGAEDDGSGQNRYNIYPNAGTFLYDLTYDPNAGNGCNWQAITITEMTSILAGDICLDQPGGSPIDLDLRANISRSKDGKKLFFTWLDTDLIPGRNPDPSDNFLKNVSPNLFGRGLDIVSKKLTPVKNFTENDVNFGGNDVGKYGGALFPAVSPTVFETGTTFTVPVVVAEVDYQSTSFNKYGVEPAQFHYLRDINFTTAEFVDSLTDVLPPVITLNGPDEVTLLLGTPYNELGATAVDCNDGQVQVTFSNNVNSNVPGTYQATYIATDAAGNSDTVVRTIIVGRVPEARFTFTFQAVPNGVRLNFTDQSLFSPTAWAWTFGAGASPASSSARNPSATYFTFGEKCVRLVATNAFGSDDTTVCIFVSGVEDVPFSENVRVYPNPTNGKIFVSVAGLEGQTVNLSLLNILGEEALPPATLKINGEGVVTIDASTLPSGSYFVRLQAEKAVAVKQISLIR